MELNVKQITIGLTVAIAVSFLIGRYTNSGKVVTKTVTVTSKTEEDQEQKLVDDNKDVTIDETDLKDGTVEKQIHITDDSKTSDDKTAQIQTQTTTQSTVTKGSTADWNVSVLASPSHPSNNLLPGEAVSYGVSVQRRILGPFSIGVFGLTNETYGASLGVSF